VCESEGFGVLFISALAVPATRSRLRATHWNRMDRALIGLDVN
jgi:hypothetical protein